MGAAAHRRTDVVLVLERGPVPAWVRRVVEEVLARPFVAASYVEVESGQARGPGAFALYVRADRALWGRSGVEDPHRACAIGDLLSQLRRWESGGRAPDVVVDLSEGGAPPAELRARHGVWRLTGVCHGDPAHQAAPFWTLYRGATTFTTALQAILPGETVTVCASVSSAAASSLPYSLHLCRAQATWKTAAFVARALDRLWATGELPRAPGPVPAGEQGPLPSGIQLARFLAGRATRLGRKLVERALYDERWHVLVRRQPRGDLSQLRLDDFRVLPAEPRRYYADPIVYSEGERSYLFFEDCLDHPEKGDISVVELDGRGAPRGPKRVILEKPVHLSYPFVFRHGEEHFLIPESAGDRRIELYRAVEFPWRWELDRVLFEGVNAADNTVLPHEGRLWLFTNIAVAGGPVDDELCLFYAEGPRAPWQPHPQNPVVSDVRVARPAGPVFRSGEELIRPSQDSSVRYGWALNLNRIEELSPTAYRERTVARITPAQLGSRCLATHTFSVGGDLLVIDGYLRRSRLAAALERLRGPA